MQPRILVCLLAVGLLAGGVLYRRADRGASSQRQQALDERARIANESATLPERDPREAGGVKLKKDAAATTKVVTVDLEGAQARALVSTKWQPMGSHAFVRPRGTFLADTLGIYASCFGDCSNNAAEIQNLFDVWREQRRAYAIKWKLEPNPPRHLRDGTMEVFVRMKPKSEKGVAAVAYVLASRNDSAQRVAMCELVVFGSMAEAERLAAVCRDMEIVAGPPNGDVGN